MPRTNKKYFKRTDKEIIEAINYSHGIVYDAAKALEMTPQGLQKRIQNSPVLIEARDKAREIEVEFLHSKMHELASNGEYRAIEFLLRKLGRLQGFGDVTELNITSQNVNTNFDAGQLSEEEQEKLYEYISKGIKQQ